MADYRYQKRVGSVGERFRQGAPFFLEIGESYLDQLMVGQLLVNVAQYRVNYTLFAHGSNGR